MSAFGEVPDMTPVSQFSIVQRHRNQTKEHFNQFPQDFSPEGRGQYFQSPPASSISNKTSKKTPPEIIDGVINSIFSERFVQFGFGGIIQP